MQLAGQVLAPSRLLDASHERILAVSRLLGGLAGSLAALETALDGHALAFDARVAVLLAGVGRLGLVVAERLEGVTVLGGSRERRESRGLISPGVVAELVAAFVAELLVEAGQSLGDGLARLAALLELAQERGPARGVVRGQTFVELSQSDVVVADESGRDAYVDAMRARGLAAEALVGPTELDGVGSIGLAIQSRPVVELVFYAVVASLEASLEALAERGALAVALEQERLFDAGLAGQCLLADELGIRQSYLPANSP